MTDGTERTDETLADVSHVHPDTHETFWSVYCRGPAVADGGRNRSRTAGDRRARTRRNGTGGDGAGSMADVDHEPPYPEPNDVWTRGFKRSGDVGTDE